MSSLWQGPTKSLELSGKLLTNYKPIKCVPVDWWKIVFWSTLLSGESVKGEWNYPSPTETHYREDEWDFPPDTSTLSSPPRQLKYDLVHTHTHTHMWKFSLPLPDHVMLIITKKWSLKEHFFFYSKTKNMNFINTFLEFANRQLK